MTTLTDEDFYRQQVVPKGWEWSGWGEDGWGKMHISRAISAGIHHHQMSIVDGVTVNTHITIAEDSRTRVVRWEHTPEGGVISHCLGGRPGSATRGLHLCFDRLDKWQTQWMLDDLMASTGREIVIAGDVMWVDFPTPAETDKFAFRGFGTGIQCALLYPTHVWGEPTRAQKIKSFFS